MTRVLKNTKDMIHMRPSSNRERRPLQMNLKALNRLLGTPADWVGQVNQRLLRPAWSLRHAKDRIGESMQRPLELCSYEGLEALPPIGKEYQQGYKRVNDRLPKVKPRLHRAVEYRRGILMAGPPTMHRP
ncbi:hypothetical protein QJQ45_008424 [Haematococcus lacustris]|nr:hypothetical protein QJQ45_008424 [Haematococcus lacustris]